MTFTDIDKAVFTQQKRDMDMCADCCFLIAQGYSIEVASTCIAHKYYTNPDEVFAVWQASGVCLSLPAQAETIREKTRQEIVYEFKYLSKRGYQTHMISKMVGFKFGMQADTAYRIWYNEMKENTSAVPPEVREERLP